MKKQVFVRLIFLVVIFFLAGCSPSPIIEKIARGEALTKEEKVEYEKNKEQYDIAVASKKEELTGELLIEKLARGQQITNVELAIFQKDEARISKLAAKRKEEIARVIVVDKLVDGQQMTQEEVKLYNDDKDNLDKLVNEKNNELMKVKIVEKLVNGGQQMTQEEMKIYLDSKKDYDELVISRKANSQQQLTPQGQSGNVEADVSVSIQRGSAIQENEIGYADVYFPPISKVPYMRKKK